MKLLNPRRLLTAVAVAAVGGGMLAIPAAQAAITTPVTSGDFAYTGTWAAGANSEKATEELNATAKLSFNLSESGSAGISGLKTPWSGNASVQVDSGTPQTISLYNSAGQTTTEWYTSPSLAAGNHTITVKVLHTKASASAGYWVSVTGGRIVNGTLGGSTPPPPPPSGQTPFDYGATGATNTTVRATVNPSGGGSSNTADATAINNAINSASSAGGGIVQLNAGQYYENSVKIINKSNVKLKGPDVPTGTQPTAMIKAGPGFLTGSQYGGYPMLTNALGASNMTVQDILFDQSGDTLNGNVSGRLSAYLVEARQATNVVFDQVWTRRPFTYSIVFADSTKFGVRNSDTQVNTAGRYDQLDGIHVLQGNSGDVVDNHVDQAFSGTGNDGDDGLVAHTIGATVSNVNYRNNWVHGGGHGHSLQLAGGSYDITGIQITGNTFDCSGAATKAGVRFGYYGSQGSKLDRITIGGASGKGNTFKGCSAFAVSLTDGPVFNTTVTYNTKDAATGGYNVPAGNGNVVANNN